MLSALGLADLVVDDINTLFRRPGVLKGGCTAQCMGRHCVGSVPRSAISGYGQNPTAQQRPCPCTNGGQGEGGEWTYL